MNPDFAIFLQIAFFLISLFYIVKSDIFFGLYYFFLFVYAFPAEIGYYYFPFLSESISAYFGEDVWWDFFNFVNFSFISFFIFFVLYIKNSRLAYFSLFGIKKSNFDSRSGIFYFAVVILIFQFLCFLAYFDQISWDTLQEESFLSDKFGLFIAMILFKQSVGITLTLYVIFRQKFRIDSTSRKINYLLFPSLLMLLAFSFKSGNRTDVAALFLGICIYELSSGGRNIKNIMKIGLLVIFVMFILIVIENIRTAPNGQDFDLVRFLMIKDYYPPAHMLLAAMSFSYVDFFEVLRSNIANSLVMMNYPYLQYGITELFNPGVASRSAGYAFYIFTEGYVAFGYWGFIYNGLILVFFLAIWRSLSRSNNKEFNIFVLALISTMTINLVRGQSSYFIKYAYMYLLPSILFYLLATNKKLYLRRVNV